MKRCSLDVHIEYELRHSLVVRPEAKPRYRVDLPDDYWNNKLTANEIFREIESHGTISSVAEETYHQNIQKFVLLADIESLIDYMYECSKLIADMNQTKNENNFHKKAQVVEPQLLRFFAHIVLALRYHLICFSDKFVESLMDLFCQMSEREDQSGGLMRSDTRVLYFIFDISEPNRISGLLYLKTPETQSNHNFCQTIGRH